MSINSWREAVERRVQLKNRADQALRDIFYQVTRSILFTTGNSFEHRQDYIRIF